MKSIEKVLIKCNIYEDFDGDKVVRISDLLEKYQQAKSELIDIQIAGLEGMKKKLPTLKTTDDIDDWSITIGKLESYNQAIDEMKAKLLKQKGE